MGINGGTEEKGNQIFSRIIINCPQSVLYSYPLHNESIDCLRAKVYGKVSSFACFSRCRP